MQTYNYNGPVWIFGNLVTANFRASTRAVSKQKALSNLTYQFKVQNGYMPNAKVTLDAKYLSA